MIYFYTCWCKRITDIGTWMFRISAIYYRYYFFHLSKSCKIYLLINFTNWNSPQIETYHDLKQFKNWNISRIKTVQKWNILRIETVEGCKCGHRELPNVYSSIKKFMTSRCELPMHPIEVSNFVKFKNTHSEVKCVCIVDVVNITFAVSYYTPYCKCLTLHVI